MMEPSPRIRPTTMYGGGYPDGAQPVSETSALLPLIRELVNEIPKERGAKWPGEKAWLETADHVFKLLFDTSSKEES